MHLDCPQCGSHLEYADKRPSFCSFCGHALSVAAPTPACDPEAATITGPPSRPIQAGALPECVGGYRLLKPLGSGGMGTVFEAEDPISGRHVALKLVSAGGQATAEALERFRQEGRLASSIAHPRCVFVLAADEDAGRPYIVMELMPGETLDDLVAHRGPLPPEEAVAKILDVIDGLREAHKLGVIHRDVKPSNCFLEADGRVKIGDFGLSKSLTQQTHLTRTGAFLGTPLYASPEQIRAEPLDPQTDLYSVAATLYFLLAGRAPHQTKDAVATLASIVADPAPPLRRYRPELSAGLEKVVLRALERDRQRRYRDLDEFREALLPFIPGRLSIGGLGIRLGAYALDIVIASMLSLPLTLLMMGGGNLRHLMDPAAVLRNIPYQPIWLLEWVVYFTLTEGIWGCSLGKRIVGLRVQTTRGVSPGLLRILWRSLVWEGLFGLFMFLDIILWLFFIPSQPSTQDVLIYANIINLDHLVGIVTGLGLLLCTMRTRNGYRGLHEFISGTRVVRLPPKPRRRVYKSYSTYTAHAAEGAQVDRLPERLGPFVLRGAIGGGVLLGEDVALGRQVWIWIRPAEAPAVPPARRELIRASRPRWLACGRNEEQQWDAFLVAPGSSLSDITAAEGPLPWPDARPLLEQLTEELVTSCADNTLPERLSVEQVWVQPSGDVQLLDFPLRTSVPETDPEAEPQGRALGLLRLAVPWMLQGGPLAGGHLPSPDPDYSHIEARIPDHARTILESLYLPKGGYRTVKKFQALLLGTSDKPVEVSRLRRLGQLAIWLGLFCLFPAGCLCGGVFLPLATDLVVYGQMKEAEYRRDELVRNASLDFLTTRLNPQPLVGVKAAAQLQQDLALRDQLDETIEYYQQQREVRVQSSSRLFGRSSMHFMEYFMDQQLPIQREQARQGGVGPPLTFRQEAAGAVYRQQGPPPEGILSMTIVMMGFWPAVWIVWAFILPGGISYRLSGLALVQKDGRPAARWRAALRQLLVWLPFFGLFLLSTWAEASYWMEWSAREAAWLPWCSWAAWWAAILVLLAGPLLALWHPGRSLHDRLSGVWLVPR